MLCNLVIKHYVSKELICHTNTKKCNLNLTQKCQICQLAMLATKEKNRVTVLHVISVDNTGSFASESSSLI